MAAPGAGRIYRQYGLTIRCARSHFGDSRVNAAGTVRPDSSSPAVALASCSALRRHRAGERVPARPWASGIWSAAPTKSAPAPGVDRQVAQPQMTITLGVSVGRNGDRRKQDQHAIGLEACRSSPALTFWSSTGRTHRTESTPAAATPCGTAGMPWHVACRRHRRAGGRHVLRRPAARAPTRGHRRRHRRARSGRGGLVRLERLEVQPGKCA